jgi:hypothetical protein
VWLDVWLYFDGVEAVAFSVNTLLALLSVLLLPADATICTVADPN